MQTSEKPTNKYKKGPKALVVISDSPLFEVVRLMFAVKLGTTEAELNKTSINDGKGGRIFL